MTEQDRRKGGGGKLSRSETVTVRLDPKLRYLAELAARKQRRTVSSFIEWAIEDTFSRIILHEHGDFSRSLADEAAELWDVDEPDRFAHLAIKHPDLLTHYEQILWKLIRENGLLWKGRYDDHTDTWAWKPDEDSLIYDRLRKYWDDFVTVAKGEQPRAKLPTWLERKPSPQSTDDEEFVPEGSGDDDIPL
jgi:hypothetical protein